MKMTTLEHAAKKQIMDILNKQGYPTYSRLLDKLDVKLIDPKKEDAIAYLVPSKATIYLNPELNLTQVSTIVRHEILHEYLTHMTRSEVYRSKSEKNKNIPHQLVNIAADYEISNRGYTDADKITARSIIIGDKVLRGLVTEDAHPDWVDKTFEEMLDLLQDEKKQDYNNIMSDLNMNPPDNEEQQQQNNQTASDANELSQSEEADKEQQQQAQSISKAAKELNKEIEQNKGYGVFKSEEEQDDEEETAKKAAELQKALNELKNQIFQETDTAIEKEKIAKRAKDAEKYKSNPLTKFIDSLNNFIKREVSTSRGTTWTRMSKKYSGSGIIRPGSSRLTPSFVPRINVYFDVSGSFTSQSKKIEESTRAIATLNKYVNKGQIKINLFYVTDDVYSNREEAEGRGGADGDAIIKHINATKPDNVIVVTDSDSEVYGSNNATVDGGVWILFYESISNLLEHIKGKKVSKQYLMWS